MSWGEINTNVFWAHFHIVPLQQFMLHCWFRWEEPKLAFYELRMGLVHHHFLFVTWSVPIPTGSPSMDFPVSGLFDTFDPYPFIQIPRLSLTSLCIMAPYLTSSNATSNCLWPSPNSHNTQQQHFFFTLTFCTSTTNGALKSLFCSLLWHLWL